MKLYRIVVKADARVVGGRLPIDVGCGDDKLWSFMQHRFESTLKLTLWCRLCRVNY